MKIFKCFGKHWVDRDSADIILRNYLHPAEIKGNVYFAHGATLQRAKVKLRKGCKRVLSREDANVIVFPSIRNLTQYVIICDLNAPTPKQISHKIDDPLPAGYFLCLDSDNSKSATMMLQQAASLFQTYKDKVIISDESAIMYFHNGLTINESNFDYFTKMINSDYDNKNLALMQLSSMDLIGSGQWFDALAFVARSNRGYNLKASIKDYSFISFMLAKKVDTYLTRSAKNLTDIVLLHKNGITDQDVINVLKTINI